jgi:hypothetical protein
MSRPQLVRKKTQALLMRPCPVQIAPKSPAWKLILGFTHREGFVKRQLRDVRLPKIGVAISAC